MGFIDGLIQGMGQAQLRKIQLDAMKSQKEAQKAEFELKKQQVEQQKYWQELLGGGGPPQPGVPQFESTGGTNPWTRGNDRLTTILSDPAAMARIKAMGGPDLSPFARLNQPVYKEVSDGRGGTMLVAIDPNTMQPLGPMMPKSMAPVEKLEVTNPDGSKNVRYVNPQLLAAPGMPNNGTFDEKTISDVSNELSSGPGIKVAPSTAEKPLDPVAGEQAGKPAMVLQAQQYLGEFQNMAMGPDGKPNYALFAKAASPVKIGDGRKFYAMFLDILDARSRIATGAGMPAGEVKNYTDMYFPGPLDNPATVQDKLTRLQNFMDIAIKLMDPSGKMQRAVSGESPSTVTPSRIPQNMMPVQDRIKQLELEKDALNADVESAFKSGDQEAAARLNEQLYAVLDQLSELRQKGGGQPVKPSLGVKQPKVIGRQGDTWKIGF